MTAQDELIEALREKVARRMYEDRHKRLKNCHPWDGSGLDDEHPGARKRWLKYADSAIAALASASASSTEEIEKVRAILAHTDMGSLPNDWTLTQIAEARIDDLLKLRDKVRDTCQRAELAEATLSSRATALKDSPHG